MSSKLVTAYIKGGLGNQMFCYAAAKRLAQVNGAELHIDNTSGFERDFKYQRTYMLDKFTLTDSIAKPSGRLSPFSRYRHWLKQKLASRQSFENRKYIYQEFREFDERLLSFRFNDKVIVNGYWQSEKYFIDIADDIREAFTFIEPKDDDNRNMRDQIAAKNAVAIHVRLFDTNIHSDHNLNFDYYRDAIKVLNKQVSDPHFFVFCEFLETAKKILDIPRESCTFVSHNTDEEMAYADMWLMSKCQHFIIANSTFSWWGAWLANNPSKIVIAPSYVPGPGVTAWNFDGLIPDDWLII